jgi:hypothetical protein
VTFVDHDSGSYPIPGSMAINPDPEWAIGSASI